MFFLILWLLWPATALVRVCVGNDADQHYRETIIKFGSIFLLLSGACIFLWLATGWLFFGIAAAVCYIFCGQQLRAVVIEEHAVDIFR
jgi:hypothetical protein